MCSLTLVFPYADALLLVGQVESAAAVVVVALEGARRGVRVEEVLRAPLGGQVLKVAGELGDLPQEWGELLIGSSSGVDAHIGRYCGINPE